MKLLKTACFILLLFLTACDVTQYVAVPINYTPKSYFNPDSTTIVIINHIDITKAQISNKKKLDVLKAAAFATTGYAQTVLGQLPHVKVINSVDSVDFKPNTDSIKTLALQYHANYVLVLKSFTADISLADYDNTAMYYNTNASVDFLLYEANGVYYKKLSGTANDPNADQPYINLFAALIIHPTVKGNKTAIKVAAEHATQDALQDYLPYSVTHQRPLYTDAYLQPAVKEILARNYNQADSLLQPLIKNSNAAIASKAMYNLAVVYEAEGDIAGATDMATQSAAKFKDDYAEWFIAALKED